MDTQAAAKPTAIPEPPEFYDFSVGGKCRFRLHLGQWRAVYSPARFILLLAGTQSGKTVSGPVWLYNEIARRRDGDYLCVAPSFQLMNKKMLPEFLRLFQTIARLGEYRAAERIFHFHNGKTKIFFGHAQDSESLESATAKAAWCDEAGQKTFRYASWKAILRRLAIHRGRCLLTTTPYDLGWLKTEVYDKAMAGDLDYEVVNFDSKENPAFPREEYDRAQRDLPRWEFNMFYRGRFERPVGLIYDCFDPKIHTFPKDFEIPDEWPRYVGLDFGGVNTAAVFLARELHPETDVPINRWWVYREYYPRVPRTAADHVKALKEGEKKLPTCAGGSKSESQWRMEFNRVGLPVMEPNLPEQNAGSVEVGISRVYGMFKRDELMIREDLVGLRDELNSYSRVLDDFGRPTEEIDEKETYHHLDALRYACAWLDRYLRTPWRLERI